MVVLECLRTLLIPRRDFPFSFCIDPPLLKYSRPPILDTFFNNFMALSLE